jgi:hypothetical protein
MSGKENRAVELTLMHSHAMTYAIGDLHGEVTLLHRLPNAAAESPCASDMGMKAAFLIGAGVERIWFDILPCLSNNT